LAVVEAEGERGGGPGHRLVGLHVHVSRHRESQGDEGRQGERRDSEESSTHGEDGRTTRRPGSHRCRGAHRGRRRRRYLGAMEHVRWALRPELHRPVAIAAFEGWNDAGDAASGAVRYLVDRWDLDPVAELDPEEFYDFTNTRPEVRLDEGGHRTIDWPATEIFAGTTPHAGDVIVIVGAEPQLRWRTYA